MDPKDTQNKTGGMTSGMSPVDDSQSSPTVTTPSSDMNQGASPKDMEETTPAGGVSVPEPSTVAPPPPPEETVPSVSSSTPPTVGPSMPGQIAGADSDASAGSMSTPTEPSPSQGVTPKEEGEESGGSTGGDINNPM